MIKALTLTTLTLALLPTAAEAAEGTFKVSLYGIQRYEEVNHEEPDPPEEQSCWDARGTLTETTVVRFSSTKPVRMKVTTSGGYTSMTPVKSTSEAYDFDLKAEFTHDGSGNREVKSCTKDGDGWDVDAVPLSRNCSASVDWMGFGVDFAGRGKLEGAGGEGFLKPLNADPFAGCPYGDVSMSLYAAKGRIAPKLLLGGRETEVILRGRERDRSEGAGGDYTSWSKKTTVYVTFKTVGG